MIFAQKYSFNYGKIDPFELSMTSYSKDSTASAVYIYNKVDARYQVSYDNLSVEYDISSKIKVLNSTGVKYANVIIPYYSNLNNQLPEESVIKIEAIAYNLENGKVVKTKMSKDYIFDERVNKGWKQIKFSIPAVKVGTVIEYRYKICSERYYSIPEWIIQQEIPIIYANYEIRIPEYFNFDIETRGSDKLNSTITPITESFIIAQSGDTERLNTNSKQYNFIANDLPALINEPYIWYPDDYKAQVSFELRGIQLPFSMYKPYSTTWENIDKILSDDKEFGGALKLENPFKNEIKALATSNYNAMEKIRFIYALAKNKIKWNGQYSLWGENIKKALKNGTGNNAEINFLLISMLKDAGFNAFPILMSRRNCGKLPFTHPSIDKLNTFIVGINNTDSTTVYIDGSVKYGDINILPPQLMSNRARIFGEKGEKAWTDLSKIGKTTLNTTIQGEILADGTISANRYTYYVGQYAAKYRELFNAAKDSTAFIENIQNKSIISIKDYTHDGTSSLSPVIKEKFRFTKNASTANDYIYINPIIFPHISTNEFTKEKRDLPIEFDYPYNVKITSILNIPAGYQVDELPKPIKIDIEGSGCSCIYKVTSSDNQISALYSFTMNNTFYTKDEYPILKTLWAKVIEKNSEQVVLKKIDNTANKQLN